ncbi:hypothetical protein B0I35DRAFT_445716 [Stachybotrys elegans]|uniref:Uncharacterized protein n=1 Tax=Stachybotrys elegans TaxID=80388 RepID=A0A8K0WK05_9HYPO|nr:hypothetical protein B0I35DRAFT_445716 [Stachybotrys elegans]
MTSSVPNSRCYWASCNELRAGSISIEDYLRDHTSHIFRGVRHEYCQGQSSDDVAQRSENDVFWAATMACMLGEAPDPATEEPLISMLLACETSTWDQIQRLDDGIDTSTRVLSNPSLAQILLARTLMVGKRPLAKDMIHNVPAAPDHDLVFSPEARGGHNCSCMVEGRDFFTHRMFKGQKDNGCDIWVDMLATGWATPRHYMFLSAASGPDETHAHRLFEELVGRGLQPDWFDVQWAFAYGKAGIINLFLDKFIEANGDVPKDEDTVRALWMTVARTDEVQFFEILIQRGIGSVSTMIGPVYDTRSNREPQRSPEMPGPPQPLLHEAARTGSPAVVEWLLDHGEDNIRNSEGQTAYNYAKGWHAYISENLHFNPHHPATVRGIEKVLEVLETRGFGP